MTVGDYVSRMESESKTARNEVIEECLQCFGLSGIRDLTLEQVAEFWGLFCNR